MTDTAAAGGTVRDLAATQEVHRVETLKAIKEHIDAYNRETMSDNPAYPRSWTIKTTHMVVLNHLYYLFLTGKLKKPPNDTISIETERGTEQWPQRFLHAGPVMTRFNIASYRTFDAHVKRFERAGLLCRKRLLSKNQKVRRPGDHYNAIAFNPNLIRYVMT